MTKIKLNFVDRNRSIDMVNLIVLKILQDNGFSHALVFQGGECERLCYGDQRYSSDMDFVVHKKAQNLSLSDIAEVLQKELPNYIENKIVLKVDDKPQSMVRKIVLKVYSDDENERKIEVPIEFVFGLAHYTEADVSVRDNRNMLGLPVIVKSEELKEILADKVVAFGTRGIRANTPFKARDIWDLYWMFSLGIELDISMVIKKLNDYHTSFRDFKDVFLKRLSIMDSDKNWAVKSFQDEMAKFVDTDVADKIADENAVSTMLDSVSHKMKEVFTEIEQQVASYEL